MDQGVELCDLYNNDAIFDKFDCCLSGDGLHFATGSYSNHLRIFSHGVGSEEGITIEASKNPNRKLHLQAAPRGRRSSLSNLTRSFYRQGNENSSSGNSEFSYFWDIVTVPSSYTHSMKQEKITV
ncbi:hypothetical protein F0562_024280 [Nyssa sinensis]|uniref:Uncharacterized protein n=1 Tax=Nyssa sinensis TaxID=561372 RepID=A0A5J5BI58_9ASTE|nr:hypothetical protein F0562_024280 [Nyssa sinensis]